MLQKSEFSPPKHLKPATKQWFQGVLDKYVLEPHHIRLLTLAGEAWDRCSSAREALQKEGMVYTDRFGCPRKRPEVSIELDNRTAFCRCLRELGLDLTDSEPSRSPGIYGISKRGR